MRNLTITRTKSFVGSLAAFKVYVEDAAEGDLVIDGFNCRKLGNLKNGQTVTFQIGEQACRIFVIADKASKDFCNDCYNLPEGGEDVTLTGKCKFNPAAGNAFRFDGNDSPEARDRRTKGTQKGGVVLVIAGVIGLIIGLAIAIVPILVNRNIPLSDKTFTAGDMAITLDSRFREVDLEDTTAAYGTSEVTVWVKTYLFADNAGLDAYTLEQYGREFLAFSDLPDTVTNADGLVYFTYEATAANGKTYVYYNYPHKTEDAIWVVTFATLKKDLQEYHDSFFAWAKSVEIN